MHKYIFSVYFFKYVFGQEVPLVNTSQGLVRGVLADNGDHYMYLGIPYSIVDQNNPFGASSPHPAFEGIFDAVDDSAICPQIEEFNSTLAGTLDCLHLSVFVPRSNDNSPKPVIVWIYGGRFEIGFYGRFLYGPKFLVRHDIIVISLNYRVGPYGFMCTDDPRVPGNQGLKDQLLALKWIKENVASFGGDPNKITVQGNSAGSMSIDLHIIRNHERRLFNQAVMQSGTSFTPFALPDTDAPLKIARRLGLEADDVPTALDLLASVDPLAVTEASFAIGIAFRPCIERAFDGVEAFVSHNWVRNDTLPLAKDLNIMIGFNDDEGFAILRGSNISVTNFIRDSLGILYDVDHEEFDSDQLRHYFFGDEEFTSTVIQDAANMRADISFVYTSIRSLYRFLKNDVQKAYLYKFSYSGGRNFSKQRMNITEGGAFHADEVGYLFDISYMEDPNVEDQLVLDRMTEMWANFVKYGDPTPQITSMLPEKWEAITPNSPHYYMDIGLELTPGTRPWHERITFWDLFFETYGHLQRYMLLDDHQRIVNNDKKHIYHDNLLY